MAKSRGDAIVGIDVRLGVLFSIDGQPSDPISVRLAELLGPDNGVRQSISVIEHEVGSGMYYVTFRGSNLVSIGKYFDRWYYTWAPGELEQVLVQDFYVSAEEAARPPVFRDKVRLAMRDASGDENYLLDDVEFPDDEIDFAVEQTLGEWNETTPDVGTYTASTFPWSRFFIIGTKGHLFHIAAANYARNHLAYSAGGVSVDDKNKHTLYLQLGDRYLSEWRQWMRDKKRSLNASTGWMSLRAR